MLRWPVNVPCCGRTWGPSCGSGDAITEADEATVDGASVGRLACPLGAGLVTARALPPVDEGPDVGGADAHAATTSASSAARAAFHDDLTAAERLTCEPPRRPETRSLGERVVACTTDVYRADVDDCVVIQPAIEPGWPDAEPPPVGTRTTVAPSWPPAKIASIDSSGALP